MPLRAVTPPCLPLPPYLRTGLTQRTTPQPVDKVSTADHKILLDKLSDMNVTRSFWLWIMHMSFLEGRTEQVNLQGVLSFTASCPAGVPQGSAISLTLFNIHINDMEKNVSEQACVKTTKYADDCTINTSIRTGESSDFQSALDSV